MTARRDGRSERARAARAVGLEVSRTRYLRTLDRLRRCERASRLAALLGPLDGVVSGRARRPVEVASADARLVVGKLWTAGERYRRMLGVLDRDPDGIDPGAGRSPAAVADLRRRLSDVPARFDAGEYRAVAETLGAAREAVRALLEAREVDCEAFAGVEPTRLEAAAEAAAEALRTEHRHRRETRRRRHEASAAGATDEGEADYRTPVGNSDQIHPAALDPENVDPDLIASLVDEDDEEPVVADDLGGSGEPDAERDEPTVEEVVGERFDIRVDDPDDADGADEGPDRTGGFRFGAVEDDETDDG